MKPDRTPMFLTLMDAAQAPPTRPGEIPRATDILRGVVFSQAVMDYVYAPDKEDEHCTCCHCREKEKKA